MDYYTVSDLARRFGIPPRILSDMFYQRRLPEGIGPIVGGRRLIASNDVAVIEAAVRRQKERAVTKDEAATRIAGDGKEQ